MEMCIRDRVDASEELHRQIALRVAELKESGQREYFRNIAIHQTEIAHYQKEGGTCAILVQSAVGCLHYTCLLYTSRCV